MSESEVTYYEAGSVHVTNTRVVLGSKTYALRNITSVSMAVKQGNVVPGIILIVLGIIIGSCVGISSRSELLGLGILIVITIFGAALFAGQLRNTRYIVRIGSASGESDALALKDQERVKQIVAAMNQAIIQRG